MFLIYHGLVNVNDVEDGRCVGGVCVRERHLSILKVFISLTCNGTEEGCIKAFLLLTDAFYFILIEENCTSQI